MLTILFIKGLIIGLAIAAPVGPIGILCMQRSLRDGFKMGFMTGLGAAFADGTYGLAVGLSFTAVTSFLFHHHAMIRILGGLFLLILGVKLMLTPIREQTGENPEKSLLHAFVTTYLLTLSNPTTVLSFVAIFAGLGIGTIHADSSHAILLVLGITVGSAFWWLLLSSFVAFVLHHRLRQAVLQKINHIAGGIIVLFGLLALAMR